MPSTKKGVLLHVALSHSGVSKHSMGKLFIRGSSLHSKGQSSLAALGGEMGHGVVMEEVTFLWGV